MLRNYLKPNEQRLIGIMLEEAVSNKLDMDKSFMSIKDFPHDLLKSRPAINCALNFLCSIGVVDKSQVIVEPYGTYKNIFRLSPIGYEFAELLKKICGGNK